MNKENKKIKGINTSTLVLTSCNVCTICWITPIGKCIYGGPFSGYVKEPEPKKVVDNITETV